MNADRLVQLFIVVALLGIAGASANAQLISPSMSDLSSFGFPSSMMDMSSAYGMPSFTQLSSIPFSSSDPTSAFTSIAMQQLSSPMSGFSSSLPDTDSLAGNQISTGSLFGFPTMSGFGTMSSLGSMSPTSLSGLGVASPDIPGLQSDMDNSLASPSSTESYTEADSGKTITIKLGDIIHVQLTSRLDQGYVWNISTTDGLNVSSNRMYSPQSVDTNLFAGVVGIQATEEWTIKAIEPGTQQINAVCTLSDGAKPGDKTFVLTVIVE